MATLTLQEIKEKQKAAGGGTGKTFTLAEIQERSKAPRGPSSTGLREVKELGVGAGKGFLSSVAGAAELGLKTAGRLGEKIGSFLGQKLGGKKADTVKRAEEKISGVKEKLRPKEGTLEKAGFGLEQFAELLVPVGQAKFVTKLDDVFKLSKVAAVNPKLAKALQTVTKGTVGGAEFGGKVALQTGGDVKETSTAALIGGLAPPVFKTVGVATKAVAPKVGKTVASILSLTTGKEKEVIERAFKNPEEVAKKLAEKLIPLDVRNKAVEALETYRGNISDTFEKGLEVLTKQVPKFGPARTAAGKFSAARKKMGELIEKKKDGLASIFRNFSVAVENKGTTLNFEKLNSAIVSGTEQKQLRQVFDTIRNQTDFSARGTQRVAAKINALEKFEQGAKTQSSAIIGKIHNLYSKAIDTVYKELGVLRAEFAADRQIADGIDDVIKSVKNDIADPRAVTAVAKRLSNLFKEDNEAYVRALKRLEQATGVDMLNSLAATEFLRGAPASFGSRIAGAGFLAGGFLTNPLMLAALPLFSPAAVGRGTIAAGKAIKKLPGLFGKAEKVAPPVVISKNKE